MTVLADTAIRGHDLDEAKANEALKRAEEARRNATDKMEIAKVEAEIVDAGSSTGGDPQGAQQVVRTVPACRPPGAFDPGHAPAMSLRAARSRME